MTVEEKKHQKTDNQMALIMMQVRLLCLALVGFVLLNHKCVADASTPTIITEKSAGPRKQKVESVEVGHGDGPGYDASTSTVMGKTAVGPGKKKISSVEWLSHAPDDASTPTVIGKSASGPGKQKVISMERLSHEAEVIGKTAVGAGKSAGPRKQEVESVVRHMQEVGHGDGEGFDSSIFTMGKSAGPRERKVASVKRLSDTAEIKEPDLANHDGSSSGDASTSAGTEKKVRGPGQEEIATVHRTRSGEARTETFVYDP